MDVLDNLLSLIDNGGRREYLNDAVIFDFVLYRKEEPTQIEGTLSIPEKFPMNDD
jgi:hypothetical protein